ncbi:Uncharacterized protein Rs2_17513 [Raphanus sativus]|nr:hypothetical protein Rs2_26361 [Raphanus sativus]KAJ4903562.1 Uncharacterized protein Rs2_17513 [Raphanus sativus]
MKHTVYLGLGDTREIQTQTVLRILQKHLPMIPITKYLQDPCYSDSETPPASDYTRQIPFHSISHRLLQRVRRRPESAPPDRLGTFEMTMLPGGGSDGGAVTGVTFWEVEE